MKARCFRARLHIPGLMDGARPSRHIRECLACQAEAARYRALGRRLRELRHEAVAAPAGLAAAAMAGLDSTMAAPGRSHALEGAAAAAGAALVVVWAMARRKRARAA